MRFVICPSYAKMHATVEHEEHSMKYTLPPRGSIVVRCPVDMRDQLKEIAEREGETVSTVVRRLIAGAVNRAKNGQAVLSGFEVRT